MVALQKPWRWLSGGLCGLGGCRLGRAIIILGRYPTMVIIVIRVREYYAFPLRRRPFQLGLPSCVLGFTTIISVGCCPKMMIVGFL